VISLDFVERSILGYSVIPKHKQLYILDVMRHTKNDRITTSTMHLKRLTTSLLTLTFCLFSHAQDKGNNLILGVPKTDGQLVNRVGYAFSYSETHEQPLFVTYELTKEEVENKVAKRKDNFRKDPLVKTGSAILDDYKRSGYDRGHLAPAADMAWSEQAMSESFYLSNMSPQNPGLNRGMWAQLESDCRKWAVENGKVHIITGPVIRPNYSQIGPNKVTVPQWYYKIVVSIKNKKAIAFIIPNRKPQKPLSSFVVTIDKIEEITKLDFLDKVPDALENRIEAISNLDQWPVTNTKITYKKPTQQKKEQAVSGNYWVSQSSGIRHNSTCKNYKKTKGKATDKNGGKRACKICGG
jgi:endonuclease G, mitochondrial